MKPARGIDVSPVLGRYLEEALRCLESTDLCGANAALERAVAESRDPLNGAASAVPGVPGASSTSYAKRKKQTPKIEVEHGLRPG